MKDAPGTVDLYLPSPLTVAGYIRHHLTMVADVSPAELDRTMKDLRRANDAADRAALRASRRGGPSGHR